MGSVKIVGVVLIVVGLVGSILSVLADTIGIGSNPGFGPTQIAGAIVGVLLAAMGLVLILRK